MAVRTSIRSAWLRTLGSPRYVEVWQHLLIRPWSRLSMLHSQVILSRTAAYPHCCAFISLYRSRYNYAFARLILGMSHVFVRRNSKDIQQATRSLRIT
ncbi:hypothetical protein K474DRAFT_1655279 [Panus rudis PR-1116 ss-1]|nr:hypothetical protein K474DRAFT_1655279 [Panus rudis PR-1116 ss-1]